MTRLYTNLINGLIISPVAIGVYKNGNVTYGLIRAPLNESWVPINIKKLFIQSSRQNNSYVNLFLRRIYKAKTTNNLKITKTRKTNRKRSLKEGL